MNRRLCGALVAVLAGTASASAQSLKAQIIRELPPGEKPVPITVSAFLIDFEQIDEATLSHKISGYLTLEWRDGRLAEKSAPALDRQSLTVDQIWYPNIEFMNEYAPREVGNAQLMIDDEGRVKYEERFKAQLATDFDLRRFPFDRQKLLLAIESFRYGADELGR